MRCHLSTGSPFRHHPRLSIGCPRRGQWMSAREDILLTSTRANRIWSCGYSHSLHRLLPSPCIVYSLADTLHSLHRLPPSPRIVYSLADTLHSLHRLTLFPHIVYDLADTLTPLHRLLPSPRIVYSLADTLHSLHHLPPSPHTVYGLADTLTPLHSLTSALASTQSRLRRRRTMRNRG